MTQLFTNKALSVFLLLAFLSLTQRPCFSQENILERTINVPDYKGNAKELISKIGKNEPFTFAYSGNVSLNYNVSFVETQMKLHEFLEVLFVSTPIKVKTKGHNIILYVDKITNNAVELTQTVRGNIIDEDSRMSLVGVTVIILGSNPIVGTTTDADGNFRLENIPIGRVHLHLSYIGYENIVISNIEVNSGKEVVLNLNMRESTLKLEAVVITTGRKKGKPVNELALVSARAISTEETKRYTGGMDDPARIVTSYAGVTASNGSSDIIVRGNSPKYMQWRLDGVEIGSPYHLDDQNATFGALTALNKNLLTTSDFYTGAFSPEYGNVLSNVMDMKLRKGNNEKFEATFGFGLLGTDLTIEGPLKKGGNGSYLVNYRYSTIGLIKDLGLLGDVAGVVNYQDATFKLVLPTKKMGIFSIFGLGGLSGFSFNHVEADGVATPGMFNDASIVKDYDKDANLANLGITNIKTLTKSSYIKTSLAYSANGFDDDLFQKNVFKDHAGQDSTSNGIQTFKSRVKNSAARASLTYNNRINAKNKLQIGTRYVRNFSNYNQRIFFKDANALVNVTDFDKHITSVNNFVSWELRLSDKITFVSGLHNTNVLLNKKVTIEPRVAVDWKLSASSSVHAGYGKHSTTEKVHNYFTKVAQPDGTSIEPNKDLGLLMADHYVLGFEKRFNDYLVAKIEGYYQHLYNLPVENNDTSYYATINEGRNYRYVPLVNKGVGKNYGIEFTLERFFDKNYYLVFNSSFYESKYKSLEGVWRNTLYNGNYIVNLLWGKEFKNIGKKKNKTLAINVKAFLGGGQRYIPLLRDSNGGVSVDIENNIYWDYAKAYSNNLVHVYNVNLSVSYKINKPNSTHEIFLDLMNIINSNAKLSEYYDESKPDKIGYTKQMVFLPNIMYRVYF